MANWVYTIGIIAIILVIIGALNWGWIGLTSTNLASTINNATFKNETWERIFYVIVGLAGLYLIWFVFYLKSNKKNM